MARTATSDGYVAPSELPFGPGSVSWLVNREVLLLAGGGRALLLQVAHPLVAAGVDQHSDFERHALRRLLRTLDLMYKLSFADREVSARQSARLTRSHRRIEGVSHEGIAYRATDPALLRWVWATLLDTSLHVYGRFVARLSDVDRERYYQEQKLVAHACGVPVGECPDTYADFAAYMERMVRDELAATEVAMSIARAGGASLLPLPLGPVALVFNTFVTTGLLPSGLRGRFGLRWGPLREALLRTIGFASRCAVRLVPASVRQIPATYFVARGRTVPGDKRRPRGPVVT
jgi:uncharacterized protein (DUF2236 family)